MVAACTTSPPPRLFLLSASGPPARHGVAAPSAKGGVVYASSQRRDGKRDHSILLGVGVKVPEYLDRQEIVVRTSANEIRPVGEARWGEDVSVTATRALAEDLASVLPQYDVIMLPARDPGAVAYAVHLDLDRFESDRDGNSTIAGRWSLLDRSGAEKASGRVAHTERAEQRGVEAIVNTMSRNIAAASAEIAAAISKVRLGTQALYDPHEMPRASAHHPKGKTGTLVDDAVGSDHRGGRPGE